jgi:hypothetical protein
VDIPSNLRSFSAQFTLERSIIALAAILARSFTPSPHQVATFPNDTIWI